MKILWIVNTIFPDPSEVLGLSKPVYGGWMYNTAEELSKVDNINLNVATVYKGVELKVMVINNITYYLLPCKNKLKYNATLEVYWEQICNQIQPEIVHVHGTEYSHGLACMRKLPKLKYLVSIQGLVSVCERYYFAGISQWEIIKNITFRDIVRLDTLLLQKRNFINRGKLEKEYLIRTQNIIGRTKWDYVHTKQINPLAKYFYCNESLRKSFYIANKWSFNNCNQYTIFLSQASYPIKGLHQVIKAVILLKKEFPEIKIRISGENIINNESLSQRVKRSGYGKVIYKLLKKNKLEKAVAFLGVLSEEEIIVEYQKAHVFICPSSIENSPNSVGEAQLIGVPVIAAYVGGVPDMVEDEKTGLLYRFEEVEMLANNIRSIFNNSILVSQLSEREIFIAKDRHDRVSNLNRLLEIYQN